MMLTATWLALPLQGEAGTVRVEVDHTFGGGPLRVNEANLTNAAGNVLSVSRLSYLLAGFELVTGDGARVALDQTAYLDVESGRTSFGLTNVPGGDFREIRFKVGLPPSLNHRDPAGLSAADPLNPALNRLHWGWQGGYVFLALEGRYRLASGELGGYSYHIATDAHLMNIRLPMTWTTAGSGSVRLRFDAAELFAGGGPLRISPDEGLDSTHSAEGDELAGRIKRGVERAFTWLDEGATPTNRGMTKSAATMATLQPSTDSGFGATPHPFEVPRGFSQPNLPGDNPLTIEGVELGRRLFFDPRLSRDNTQSCSSCHDPQRAFTDGRAVSLGAEGQPGTRNAMPLFNLAWQSAFFWDGRASSLREQALKPIEDEREMGESLERVMEKLSADPEVRSGFARAFGAPEITPTRLAKALEQYLLTLVSADSKFDRALRGRAQFTEQEQRGLRLFITEYDPARGRRGADCFHCHGGNLFSDHAFKNNGLDAVPGDAGRARVTGKGSDLGKFKTPSLRNVEVTAPYMHDGRFQTLEEVVRHYSSGVVRNDSLDPNLAKHSAGGVQLTAEDAGALVAFLKTLTDESLREADISASAGEKLP